MSFLVRRLSAPGRSRARGFSLIEVMASSAILAVGMAAILSLFGNLRGNYSHQRFQVQALHIAESVMEDLLLEYADDDELDPGNHTGVGYTVDGRPGGSFFSTAWNVIEDVPVTGVRQVTITVTWTEDGMPKSFVLRTVRT